jgi:predicted ATPase/DNA-binding SARP family transcriptional activator
MEFRILGPLEVWDGERRLPLGGAKQRALLAILVIEANRVVPAARLIELLWGDEPSETAANTLQVGISHLRKLLEPTHARGTPYQVLLTEAPGYMLRLAPERLDFHRFEQLRQEARQATLRGRPDTAAVVLRDALALWHGSPLIDLKDEPFTAAQAARLSEMRLQAIEDRIEADLVLGQESDVVAELETLVADYPLRERLRGQFMIALYRCGRQADASDVFHKTRAALIDQVGMEPGPELQRLFKAILRQDPSLDLAVETAPLFRPRSNNLPLQLTSFVGRVQEKIEVERLLSESRLVTIMGVGGAGKSRLALQVAGELIPRFNEGVWLTELASLTDGALVGRAVASTLGLREQPERPIEEIIIAYLERRQILLVIDNCEHLVQAVAELIETLLRRCGDLRVLATSREALRIEGETAWSLRPLPIPDAGAPPDVTAQSEAVRLFQERGAAASFLPTPDNLPAVAEICRRLDGLPLGIELAAATLHTLPVQQVAASLDDRFRTLVVGRRSALPRQQTLETSIGWSYELLSEPEQTLFRRLAVFSGSFGVEHVIGICSGLPVDRDDAFRLLSILVAKSLVMFDGSGPEARYSLLETVHQYAKERLTQTAEDAATRDRHLDWYCSLAERAAVAIHGPDQAKWLGLLDNEYSNLRQALRWASGQGTEVMARLAWALTFFWMVRGYLGEGRDWLRQAVDSTTDPLIRARALTGEGLFACLQSDSASAQTMLLEACRLLEKLDDPATHGMALKMTGWDYLSTGQTSKGLAFIERGLGEARKVGPSWELACNLNDVGFFAHVSGDRSARPRIILEEALKVARDLEDAWVSALTLDSLALVAADSHDFQTAQVCWQECITIAVQLKDRWNLPSVLYGFARVALVEARHERAMRLMAAASRLTSEIGAIWPQAEQEPFDRTVQQIREALGEGPSDLAWRLGQSMTLQEAIEYATERQGPVPTRPSLVPVS